MLGLMDYLVQVEVVINLTILGLGVRSSILAITSVFMSQGKRGNFVCELGGYGYECVLLTSSVNL